MEQPVSLLGRPDQKGRSAPGRPALATAHGLRYVNMRAQHMKFLNY